MGISVEEQELFEQERQEYRKLLQSIRKSRKTNQANTLSLSCIGNGGGSDSVIQGHPSGGFLIRYADRKIIVDPGENTLAFLHERNFDPYQITDIIASHSHNDHIGDLASTVAAALQLNLNGSNDVNILVSPTLVDYSNSEATRYGFTLPAFAWEGNVKVLNAKPYNVTHFSGRKVSSQKEFRISDEINVTAVGGRHASIPAGGFIISTPVGSVAYTSDTEYFPELEQEYAGVDCLWLNINTVGLDSLIDEDAALPDETRVVRNHLGYNGVCRLIEAVKPSTAIVSHFGSQLRGLEDRIQELLRARFRDQNTRIFCAHTGDEFVYQGSVKEEPAIREFSA